MSGRISKPAPAYTTAEEWKTTGYKPYDEEHPFSFTTNTVLDVMFKAVDDAVSFASATAITDVGCGAGTLFDHLFTSPYSVLATASLIALDISPAMLKQLRVAQDRAPTTSPWHRVQSLECDAIAMNRIASGSQSHVLSQMGIFLIPDHLAAVREVRRVMALGGVFAMSAVTWSSWMNEVFLQIRFWHPGRESRLPKIPDIWSHSSRVEALMKEAGFDHVEIIPVNSYIPFNDPSKMIDMFWEMPFTPALTGDLTAEEVKQLKDHYTKYVAETYTDGKMPGKFVVIVAT